MNPTAMPSTDLPNDHTLSTLQEGTVAEHRYRISEAIWRAFTDLFEDRSPVHVDATHARAAGFEDRVMHGAILNGFVSHFVGMVMPGRRSLLLTVDMRYLTPSYLGDEILLRGEVTQRVESQSVVVMTLTLENVTRGRTAGRARAQVKVSP